jgi:hypothetical protein
MFYLTKNVVTLSGLTAANWLNLWRAQLQSFQRCCDISNELNAAWRASLESASASLPTSEDSGASSADQTIEKLFACWSRMYYAATLHDALNEYGRSSRILVEDRVGEFKANLAAARNDDRLRESA